MSKTKIIHIIIIVLGILFVSASAFHENMWFDESYSVAIASNYSLSEIWEIGGHDVHPILYYWMLNIVGTLTGNSILMFRLFSVLAIAILGIIGYTHIRKDFGENVGLVFSFFAFFMPTNIIYASEIRMYTWGMLFVVLLGIYAYRLYKDSNNIKNWILFALFSICSAYTHYYGLMAAGLMNLLVMIYFITKAIKAKKWIPELTKFIIQGVIEVLLYIPWVLTLFTQMKQVESGFWIQKKSFFDTAFDIFLFQFTGNLDNNEYISNNIGIFFGLFIISAIFFIIGSNKDKIKKDWIVPATSVAMYILVIIGAVAVSNYMNRAILYARYMLVTTGLLLIAISYIIGKYGSKKLIITILAITVIVGTLINYKVMLNNYDESNQEPIQYLKQNIKEGDIIIYKNVGGGFIISTVFSEFDSYFYNAENWGVEEAYKAFGRNYHTVNNLEFLNNYYGRIWFIDANDYSMQETATSRFNDIKVLETQRFEVKYKGYPYTFSLTQKGE
ncbi:MAG: glycosyltransferase family 39 protein [Clostridia bacterium]|nr:glycosyltransferase family 39 protein [Clostridia bacterium]